MSFYFDISNLSIEEQIEEICREIDKLKVEAQKQNDA